MLRTIHPHLYKIQEYILRMLVEQYRSLYIIGTKYLFRCIFTRYCVRCTLLSKYCPHYSFSTKYCLCYICQQIIICVTLCQQNIVCVTLCQHNIVCVTLQQQCTLRNFIVINILRQHIVFCKFRKYMLFDLYVCNTILFALYFCIVNKAVCYAFLKNKQF